MTCGCAGGLTEGDGAEYVVELLLPIDVVISYHMLERGSIKRPQPRRLLGSHARGPFLVVHELQGTHDIRYFFPSLSSPSLYPPSSFTHSHTLSPLPLSSLLPLPLPLSSFVTLPLSSQASPPPSLFSSRKLQDCDPCAIRLHELGSSIWRGIAWHDVMWCGVVWCGVVWCVFVRRGVAGDFVYRELAETVARAICEHPPLMHELVMIPDRHG
jgi:hypothetical protein